MDILYILKKTNTSISRTCTSRARVLYFCPHHSSVRTSPGQVATTSAIGKRQIVALCSLLRPLHLQAQR